MVERDRTSLILGVVRDVGCLDRGSLLAAFRSRRGRVELEFVSVECYRLHGVLDLDLNVTLALVGPWFAGFEVEEGDGVVDRFDTVLLLAIRST